MQDELTSSKWQRGPSQPSVLSMQEELPILKWKKASSSIVKAEWDDGFELAKEHASTLSMQERNLQV